MNVVIGQYSGFCGGVKVAIKKTNEALDEDSNLYCLGDVVHNKQVIENLENKGLKIVYDIHDVPDGSRVVIRAHGEAEEIYNIANSKNLQIIDTTCGNVIAIHNKLKKAREDSFIIVMGQKDHPEVISHIGFAGKNSIVVEDENDILDAYMEFEKTGLHKVYVIAQTTFSSSKFDELEKEIYTNFVEADVVVDKTVCNATEIRQSACENLAKDVDCMVVIGGEKSANTLKLVDISKQNCKIVYFIQTVKNLEGVSFDGIKKVGIMAGASTPDYIIQEVKNYLEEV